VLNGTPVQIPTMKTNHCGYFQLLALMFALHLSLPAQEKPVLSAEIFVETVSAVQQELGITKLYDVILVNKTTTTAFVNQCELTDDTLQKFVVTPFELQRWNPETKRWEVVVAHAPDYCRGNRWTVVRQLKTPIAPGQKLHVNGDFVGANDAFSFGDRGRFMVFLHSPGDYSNIAVSPEFQIDEHRSKTTGSAQSGDLLTRENVTARRSDSGSYYLLDVSFAVPDVPDLKFDTITIYGMQIIGKQRSHDMAYPSVHGSWQPKEHVEFSVRVLKEYADPSLGWNLTFCVGSTAGCYPSPNLLTLIAQNEQ
jgi:hypothetical protein